MEIMNIIVLLYEGSPIFIVYPLNKNTHSSNQVIIFDNQQTSIIGNKTIGLDRRVYGNR